MISHQDVNSALLPSDLQMPMADFARTMKDMSTSDGRAKGYEALLTSKNDRMDTCPTSLWPK
jgi:hypothetical protein